MGRKAVAPPGEAREDWWIEVQLAQRMGLAWSYESPADVFAEMKLNMRSLDNITWKRLEIENAVTYPSLSEDDPGQAIVFGTGFPSKRVSSFTWGDNEAYLFNKAWETNS